jgi:hypothetical protein
MYYCYQTLQNCANASAFQLGFSMVSNGDAETVASTSATMEELVIDVDADEAEHARTRNITRTEEGEIDEARDLKDDEDEFADPFCSLPGIITEGSNYVNGPDDDYSDEMTTSEFPFGSSASSSNSGGTRSDGFVSVSESVAALSSYTPASQKIKVLFSCIFTVSFFKIHRFYF